MNNWTPQTTQIELGHLPKLKYIETCHSVITKSVSMPMSREKYAVKSSREHPKDASLDTKKPPRAPKRETRDARDTPDPRPGDFALIFMRVKLKNDDSAAEWRGRHSSTTTPAHKNDWKKCYDNNGPVLEGQCFT